MRHFPPIARRGATILVLLWVGVGGARAQGLDASAGPADGGLADGPGAGDSAPAPEASSSPSSSSLPEATPVAPAAPPVAAPAGGAAPLEETPVPSDLVAHSAEGMDELDLNNLLENVVVTATKSALREDEAPAITTVVNREEIRRWGYRSVAEVLSHIAGVYLIDDHNIPNLGLRGVSGGLRSESGLVKVMIDGRSVAFRSTAGNWLGAPLVPLSAIQQIEIIRGPASALYGADAFLGVINVVTRRPETMEGGEVAFGATRNSADWGGSQDVSLGVTRGRWQLFASYASSTEDRSGLVLPSSSPAPTVPIYAPANRAAHGLVLSSRTGLGSIGYRLSPQLAIALRGYVSTLDSGAEFADWAQLTHNLDSAGRRNGTDVSLRHGFGNLWLGWQPAKAVDVTLNATMFAGGPTARDRIETGSDIFYIRRDFGYRGYDATGEATWRVGRALTILGGAEVVADQQRLPVIYQVAKTTLGDVKAGESRRESAEQGRVTLRNSGVHGLALWSPWSRVSLIAGARYDHHNIYGGKLSGRLGGVLALAPNLHFKLLYGSAFKAPSPQLLYGAPVTVGDISGNRALKPSYVHTVEGQLAYRPAPYLVLTTGVAYSYLLDQAEFAQVGVNQVAQNVAQVASISWETEFKFDWRKRIALYANLSLNRTDHHTDTPGYVAVLTSYRNPAYPPVVANVGASSVLPRLPLRLSVEGSFVSSRRSSGTNTLELGQRYELPAFVTVGASLRTVGLQLIERRETTFSLTSRNVLDTRAADPGFSGVDYPRLGRSIFVQVVQQL